MKLSLFVAALSTLFLLMAACSPIQSVTPNSAVNPSPIAPTGAPASGAQPANPPTAIPAGPSDNQPQPPNNGPVTLQVLSPQDGDVVNASQIEVSGLASAGEVVTVNDTILVVGPDGKFSTTISLDEGPNLIEVIASNDSGSETSVELTITYQP